MTKRNKILWLASWYPSRLFPYNGDFIQRHARAAALYDDIHLIHVVKDEEGKITTGVHTEEKTTGGLKETIIYYHIPSKLPVLHRLLSAATYHRLFNRAAEEYIRKEGKPDLVQVQVGMKAGLTARRIWKKYQIPYVVTEHWTGFLEEAGDEFERLPFFSRRGWKDVIRDAASASFVSEHLYRSVIKKIPCRSPVVIPNVVDTSLFYPLPGASVQPGRFIHISGMDERKNPRLLLAAFKMLGESHPEARLVIFGSANPALAGMIKEEKLEDMISVHPEVPQAELANELRRSLALVLYSAAETFGCVIIEAQASGVPVIVSDIPVFHETVTEGVNGYFARPGDPEALARRLAEMIRSRSGFDSQSIAAEAASRYSYPVVGKQISDWYKEVLAGV